MMVSCCWLTMGFHLRPFPRSTQRTSTALNMGFGDMMKKALANENLGPQVNPGLSKEPESVEVEFMPSGKKVKAFPGQKISMIAQSAGVGIKYNCKKGDCGTCMINFDGKLVKACQTSLPSAGSSKKFKITIVGK
jgi:ferredoxin